MEEAILKIVKDVEKDIEELSKLKGWKKELFRRFSWVGETTIKGKRGLLKFIEEEKGKSYREGRIKQLEEDIEQVKEFLPYQERVEDTEEYWIPTSILLELEDDLKVLRKAKVLEENLRKGGK